MNVPWFVLQVPCLGVVCRFGKDYVPMASIRRQMHWVSSGRLSLNLKSEEKNEEYNCNEDQKSRSERRRRMHSTPRSLWAGDLPLRFPTQRYEVNFSYGPPWDRSMCLG